MPKLTKTELETNAITQAHIDRVRELLCKCELQLRDRGLNHDKSKLESPEVELFAKYTPELASLTFGSEEYEQSKENLKPALDHHYANNRHHPQKFKNGINDMTLVDILEMLCDWKASSERQHDGNILISVEKAAKDFGITKQLAQILLNTINMFEWNES
jgi:hypothetical protein